MHFEFLVEDSSSACLLEHLIPKLIGPPTYSHTWKLHAFQGIGCLPTDLLAKPNRFRRQLLDQLPALLRSYAKTANYRRIVVVCDTDQLDCRAFLAELRHAAKVNGAEAITTFRLAIEETEAWYLGDHDALLQAYPASKKSLLRKYIQDSVCNTWERLADIVYPGGSAAVTKTGWPEAGYVKHEWANRIGPLMDPDRNRSPSFGKFRDGLRHLAAQPSLS